MQPDFPIKSETKLLVPTLNSCLKSLYLPKTGSTQMIRLRPAYTLIGISLPAPYPERYNFQVNFACLN